jgi:hypothetical protein
VPRRVPANAMATEPKGWARFLIGGVAAMAVLFVIDVATLVQLVCGSLVAGYAGIAVLEALESRFVAMVAVRDNEELRTHVDKLNHDATRLANRFDSLTMSAALAPTNSAVVDEINEIRKRREWT